MARAYSEDFRLLVVKKYLDGMNRLEVLSLFEIGSDTLTRWVRSYREVGSLSPKARGRYKTNKLNDNDLLEYIESREDATLHEMGKEFNCSYRTVDYHLRKLGITRKKNHTIQGKKGSREAGVSKQD